ncbi:hypothetical protein AB0E08_42060 [Streptomyces sp. NPDC048281]|uniref:hypothetical protein n=1 Tax=Streptomyces sp. NPDC048281 TaxID=3154715 RepID=UPI003444C7C1
MLPTTGPEASLTVVLVALPLFTAVETLLPRCFGTRLDHEVLKHRVRHFAIAWPFLLIGALTLPAMARKARAALDVGSSSSPWYLWICALVAILFITVTAVETVRAARAEVRLRPVADELLTDLRALRGTLRQAATPDGQEALDWLDEAQAALDNGRGRTSVRYLRHALTRMGRTAYSAEAVHDAETPSPLDAIRQRVDEADQAGGSFHGPPLKA